MTCGPILVHNWEPGFDLVFGQAPPLRFFRKTEDACFTARQLLNVAEADIHRERARARELALSRFTLTHVQDYMVTVLRELWQSRLAGIAPHPIPNPWLACDQAKNGPFTW